MTRPKANARLEASRRGIMVGVNAETFVLKHRRHLLLAILAPLGGGASDSRQ